MSTDLIFGRLITAMVTPFTKEGDVDFDQAIHVADYLIENETDALLLAGTTGESPTLSHEEEYQLFDQAVKRYKGKVPVIAGTGSNSTKTAIASSQKAEQIGVDGLLLVVPYYNKPSQEGLYQHFKAIAESVSIPIMLYNIPGRTSKNMEVDTIKRLAEIPNITSIKEAAGDLGQLKEIVQTVGDDLDVYSGDDGLTLEFMREGAVGVVSVASHVAGKQMKALIQAVLDDDLDLAKSYHQKMMPLFDALFMTSNPVPVKHAMTLLGFPMGTPRLPLVALTDTESKKLEEVLDSFLGV